MKTAMQELIEWIEQRFNNPQETEVFKKATELLEKEKEQIIDAHLEGWSDAYDYLKLDSNEQARQAEDYYNETYNQNK